MIKAILDCEKLAGGHDKAHAYLKQELELPEYYGMNLDALYDCLSSHPGTIELLLRNASRLEESAYAKKIVETFCQAAAVTGGHVIMEYEAPVIEEMEVSEE